MCDPVTIGTIAGTLAGGVSATTAGATALGLSAALTPLQALTIGATVGSGVMEASAAYQQGQVARQVARSNARMSEFAAQDAQRRGEEDVQAIQRKASQLQGAQRSIMAARGLDLSSGTPAEILDSTDFFAEADSATARFNAGREAWSMRQAGRQGLYEGRMAARAGTQQAVGTLIGTGGTVADRWLRYGGR